MWNVDYVEIFWVANNRNHILIGYLFEPFFTQSKSIRGIGQETKTFSLFKSIACIARVDWTNLARDLKWQRKKSERKNSKQIHSVLIIIFFFIRVAI